MSTLDPEANRIRLLFYDGEKAFAAGREWPETEKEHARYPEMQAHFNGMYAVYCVSLLDEWQGLAWLGKLDKMKPDAGHTTEVDFPRIPGGPIKEIGAALKGVRVAFAHSMGKVCALADAGARRRVAVAADVFESVTLGVATCPPLSSCPGHGGSHERVLLSQGFTTELDSHMRRVFLAFNPAFFTGLVESQKRRGRPPPPIPTSYPSSSSRPGD